MMEIIDIFFNYQQNIRHLTDLEISSSISDQLVNRQQLFFWGGRHNLLIVNGDVACFFRNNPKKRQNENKPK